jgi:hypothetical protein
MYKTIQIVTHQNFPYRKPPLKTKQFEFEAIVTEMLIDAGELPRALEYGLEWNEYGSATLGDLSIIPNEEDLGPRIEMTGMKKSQFCIEARPNVKHDNRQRFHRDLLIWEFSRHAVTNRLRAFANAALPRRSSTHILPRFPMARKVSFDDPTSL